MKNTEAKNNLSRNHLETLTSSQLIALADQYGIDIPDDLNRRFIIAELLEVAKELDENANFKETIKVTEDAVNSIATELPESYNETKIDVLMRNPVSLFVYWDISEVQLKKITSNKISLHLQVCLFDEADSEKPAETFDIQINHDDREQYIVIPGAKKYVRVDLIQNSSNAKDNILAVSSRIEIPQGSAEFKNFQPGHDQKIKPILELSGIKTMFKNLYNNYRQSFN